MMNVDDVHEIMETHRATEAFLSETIKISHGQVLKIVVDELIRKYKFNADRNDREWASAFHKVMTYYMSEAEIDTALEAEKGDE